LGVYSCCNAIDDTAEFGENGVTSVMVDPPAVCLNGLGQYCKAGSQGFMGADFVHAC
jgi:hypothetical protein